MFIDIPTKEMLMTVNKNGHKYDSDIIPRCQLEDKNVLIVLGSTNGEVSVSLDKVCGKVLCIFDDRAEIELIRTPLGKLFYKIIEQGELIDDYCLLPVGLGKINQQKEFREVSQYNLSYFNVIKKDESSFEWKK